MASVLDQLPGSRLSLQGNGFNPAASPGNTTNPSWGFLSGRGPIPNPYDSKLHYEDPLQPGYSVDGTPTERVVDFNSRANQGLTLLGPPSLLDELDTNAPSNPAAGGANSVVSQIYKSKQGRQYRQLGPQPGFY